MQIQDISGTIVKSYELRELIGHGGFGAVYRAYQPLIKREVAVKVILSEYANQPNFIRRFEMEAQLVARLEHLHIVPLYDYWRDPDGAYLVMRWLRGASLHDVLKKDGEWDIDDTAKMLDQVAAALTVAHRNGVIHRDMKPANLLLDEDRNVYLSDFGIAKDLTATDAQEPDTVVGSFAYMSPEQIKKQPVSPQTDLYGLGLVLFETLTGQRPFAKGTYSQVIRRHMSEPLPNILDYRPDLPEGVNAVLQRATAKEPLDRYPDAIALAHAFWNATADHRSRAGAGFSEDGQPTTWTDTDNPYKGLRAFSEADSADYFGREVLVKRLIGRLAEDGPAKRFLAVVGPSGSGKSSVVRAGLIPALRRGDLPGSDRWFIVEMTPGSTPLENLAAALSSVSVRFWAGLEAALRRNEAALASAVKRILVDRDELLLVIDQFEELFTQASETDRAAFLRGLLAAVNSPESKLRVIVTLRADFYDRPLLYPGFGELMRECTEVVLPLSTEEMERAIVGPAERAGLVVEPPLVAALVSELHQEPGGLPLLQYALTELFERRDQRRLTLDAYRSSGGAVAALARRADDLYTSMNAAQQQAARQLLLRLVTPGETTEDTRRRIRWSEMLSVIGDEVALQQVLALFGQYRLLTFDNDAETREPTVEIAHEALIRRWGRLRGWLDESREDLREQRRLAEASTEWLRHDRNTGFLPAGMRLQQFEALADTGRVALSRDERDYLLAATSRRDTLAAEEQARQAREAALERRARRRLQGLVAILASAAVVALLLTALALNARQAAETSAAQAVTERDRANTQAKVARSRELAVRSAADLAQNRLDLALLFALEADHTADTFEARSSLLAGLQAAPYLSKFLHGSTDWVRKVIFSPDGSLIASAARDGTIRLWNADGSLATVQFSPANAPWSLAMNSDTLAAGEDDGSIEVWNVGTGQLMNTLEGHTGAVYGLAYSPDRQRLASASADGTIRLWNVQTSEAIGVPLTGHTDAVWSVDFSPDGLTLASGSADGTIRLWNAQTGEAIGEALPAHDDWVLTVAFSPDGALLASGGADNVAKIWAVNGSALTLRQSLTGHEDWVRDAAFSTDSATLATASADGTIRLWNAQTGEAVGEPLQGHDGEVWSVAFSPDGHTFASGGTDGRVLLWDMANAIPLGHVFQRVGSAVQSAAFSPDGSRFAAATDAGQVEVWNAASRHLEGSIGAPGAVSIAWRPDGQQIAIGREDGMIQSWDTRSADSLTRRAHNDFIFHVLFSPDGQTLVSSSQDQTIRLWNAATNEQVGELAGHNAGVSALAYSPDGSLIVSGDQNGTIILWNASDRNVIRQIDHAHDDQVTSLSFSSDGAMLASGGWDDTVRLWDVRSGDAIGQPLVGHQDWVFDVAFRPRVPDDEGASFLASASADGTILLWDIASGQPLGRPFTGHSGWAQTVAFSSDGRLLASGGADGAIIFWNIDLSSWRERACSIANRSFSADEVRLFQVSIDTCSPSY